jgi:hypothetical protein
MSVENWWSDAGRGKLKYLEKNMSHCHCVHHISLRLVRDQTHTSTAKGR